MTLNQTCGEHKPQILQIFFSSHHEQCVLEQCESASGPWEPQAPPRALSCHRDVNKRGRGGGSSFSPERAGGVNTPYCLPHKNICCRWENCGKNMKVLIKPGEREKKENSLEWSKARKKNPLLIFWQGKL